MITLLAHSSFLSCIFWRTFWNYGIMFQVYALEVESSIRSVLCWLSREDLLIYDDRRPSTPATGLFLTSSNPNTRQSISRQEAITKMTWLYFTVYHCGWSSGRYYIQQRFELHSGQTTYITWDLPLQEERILHITSHTAEGAMPIIDTFSFFHDDQILDSKDIITTSME